MNGGVSDNVACPHCFESPCHFRAYAFGQTINVLKIMPIVLFCHNMAITHIDCQLVGKY